MSKKISFTMALKLCDTISNNHRRRAIAALKQLKQDKAFEYWHESLNHNYPDNCMPFYFDWGPKESYNFWVTIVNKLGRYFKIDSTLSTSKAVDVLSKKIKAYGSK